MMADKGIETPKVKDYIPGFTDSPEDNETWQIPPMPFSLPSGVSEWASGAAAGGLALLGLAGQQARGAIQAVH